MSDTNNVVLIGRLTRDAALSSTANGKSVAKFSLAVNKKRKVGDEWKDDAHFFEIVLWGRMAESLHRYLTKGKQIAITGELNQDRWEQDGQNRSKVTVIASSLQLLGGGSNSDNSPMGELFSQPATGGDDNFADEIPF